MSHANLYKFSQSRHHKLIGAFLPGPGYGFRILFNTVLQAATTNQSTDSALRLKPVCSPWVWRSQALLVLTIRRKLSHTVSFLCKGKAITMTGRGWAEKRKEFLVGSRD